MSGQRLVIPVPKGGVSLLALRSPKGPLQSLPLTLSIETETTVTACSKGASGLSVLLRVGGIFTATTTSLSSSLRQRSTRYTIRPCRNLPDKEFRYLRTVIVTADIHGDFGSQPRACALTAYHHLSASVTFHTLYLILTTWQSAVFLLTSL